MLSALALGAATGLTLLSTAAGVQSAGQEGKYTKKVYDQNALIAARLAQIAKERGDWEITKRAMETRQAVGTQKATFAGQGVDLSSETVTNTIADTMAVGRLDELYLRYNAELEAYKYQMDRINATQQGKLAKRAAGQTQAQFILGGAASLLSMWGMASGNAKPPANTYTARSPLTGAFGTVGR